ncbi:hypothetical protein [Natronococcus occultus]|uniref:Uncharacterized protein n=1 Tax=Natronococcus occultus SP4 TaxID=694430 RepID=L0K735_9EURY|nr:hypothetical protein [Natronococcus occultus]AGB39938.1 hypothetical protein Natoc_4246 [Natronococcus occultus SP4]
MPQTVTVDGEEMLVGDRTTVAAVRKFADVSDDAIAFYREDDVVRLLQNTEVIVERVPEGTAIEF